MRIAAVAAALVALFAPVVRLVEQVSKCGPGEPFTRPTTCTRVATEPGNRWEKEGRRGGKMTFSESVTEYRNQDGVLCVTATSVGVQTERAVDQ